MVREPRRERSRPDQIPFAVQTQSFFAEFRQTRDRGADRTMASAG
jgi:hypothetical protein